MSKTDVLVHDIPVPVALRVVLCAVGAFFAFIAPYELWRGVWPLNIGSPLFAMFIIAGWSGAFVVISMGLFSAPTTFEFRAGELAVSETMFWKTKRKTYPVAEIFGLKSVAQLESDGPDRYYVEISITTGDIFKSRMFDTLLTAQKFEAEFRRALGM